MKVAGVPLEQLVARIEQARRGSAGAFDRALGSERPTYLAEASAAFTAASSQSTPAAGKRLECPQCGHRWLDKYQKDEASLRLPFEPWFTDVPFADAAPTNVQLPCACDSAPSAWASCRQASCSWPREVPVAWQERCPRTSSPQAARWSLNLARASSAGLTVGVSAAAPSVERARAAT